MSVSTDLDRRFREAAVRAGLLDAGYDVVESPVGPLFVAATERGLLRISFDPAPDDQLERLAAIVGPRVLRAPRRDRPGPARARRVLRGPPPRRSISRSTFAA